MPPKASNVAREIWLTQGDQAFENTSTSVAASQMRNALNNLADGVTDPKEKKVSTDMLSSHSHRHSL